MSVTSICPPEDRICQVCKLEAETEEHFVLSCPEYRELRKSMLLKVSSVSGVKLYSMEHDSRLGYLFNAKDINVIKAIMTYLHGAYGKRKQILSA